MAAPVSISSLDINVLVANEDTCENSRIIGVRHPDMLSFDFQGFLAFLVFFF